MLKSGSCTGAACDYSGLQSTVSVSTQLSNKTEILNRLNAVAYQLTRTQYSLETNLNHSHNNTVLPQQAHSTTAIVYKLCSTICIPGSITAKPQVVGLSSILLHNCVTNNLCVQTETVVVERDTYIALVHVTQGKTSFSQYRIHYLRASNCLVTAIATV